MYGISHYDCKVPCDCKVFIKILVKSFEKDLLLGCVDGSVLLMFLQINVV